MSNRRKALSKKALARQRRAAKRTHRTVEDYRIGKGLRADGIAHQKYEQ